MLYLDVDAVCKLAHWNILPLLPELTRRKWIEMTTVSSLKYRALQAEQRPDGKLFRSIGAAKVVSSSIAMMSPAPDPDSSLLSQLAEIPQIDPGEAVLLSIVAQDVDGQLLTGDKRAIRALAAHSIAERFVGKLISVEQILEKSLRAKGRDWFLSNVCPQRAIDKAVSMILGSRCDASLENLNQGIDSYINELKALRDPSLLSASDGE
jgi:hypothetical protein